MFLNIIIDTDKNGELICQIISDTPLPHNKKFRSFLRDDGFKAILPYDKLETFLTEAKPTHINITTAFDPIYFKAGNSRNAIFFTALNQRNAFFLDNEATYVSRIYILPSGSYKEVKLFIRGRCNSPWKEANPDNVGNDYALLQYVPNILYTQFGNTCASFAQYKQKQRMQYN